MTPPDLRHRFDFLVGDIARLHGRRFERQAREHIGLSLPQVRLIGALAVHGGAEGLTQNDLAEHLELTPMGVAALSARMQVAGWITRHTCPHDGRAWRVQLTPSARRAFGQAMAVADALQEELLGDLSADERRRLVRLLERVHQRLAGPPHRRRGDCGAT